MNNARGFTLLELLAGSAITAILLVVAIPSYALLRERLQLRAAAETVFADLQFARAQAITQYRRVVVSLSNNAEGWCYGINFATACDCAAVTPKPRCALGTSNAVPNRAALTLTATQGNASFSFSADRGLSRAGHVEISSENQTSLRVVRSSLGRLRLCTPAHSSAFSTIRNRPC